MSLSDRWTHILEDTRARGCYRSLTLPRGIDLCSNDYLGYAARERAADGATRSPSLTDAERQWSATAARLLRGHHAIWDEVESTLASWHAAARTLMFSSGYAANEGLLSAVITRDDWVASDQWNHASIIDGLRLSRAERFIYAHCQLDQLEEAVRRAAANRSPSRELFIVTESLFGMDGDVAPLREIAALADRYGAHVIVDEAHATGCYGPSGSGLVDSLGLRDRVLATVHTGGKALGVLGAYVAGSSQLREWLVNRCRHFMFSTALPPAVGAWWRAACERVKADTDGRSVLHDRAVVFRRLLREREIEAGGSEYIVPIVVGSDRRAESSALRLRARGWDIRAIRSPTVPRGTARLRISIHADHDPQLLADVAAGLPDALREVSDE